ncbi:phosphomethylpyrimidine kinase [Acidianus sp. DSM 29099]|nr:thiamine-phosphate synthase family protein [Candidatus Acidianus copahuensis]NON61180.1 phosphomethylpyrimidine kinase [Acidianus sp. RZ1]
MAAQLSERDLVLKELKEAADYFVSNEKSYILIPEIRTNLGFAISNPKDEKDVAAFPGRLTVAFGRVIYCLPPAFGASDHVARIILTAMKYNKSLRSAINLKYLPNVIKRLEDVYFFDRKSEPEESKQMEGHTMNFMVKMAYESLGHIPQYLVDLGDYGKEPGIFILSSNPTDVVKKSLLLLNSL